MIKKFQKHLLKASVLLFSINMLTTYASEYITPSLVNIPAGEFMMGTRKGDARAKPIHKVAIDSFRLGKYPVTVAEFRKFVENSGYSPEANCLDKMGKNWFRPSKEKPTASWDKHRFQQSEYQPVTCVSWQDINEYIKWLNLKTGINFRLPTEQEWEYATKANTNSRFFWGDDLNLSQACKYGNFADISGEYIANQEYGASYVGFLEHANCDDGEAYNSIVGLYRPNPFGLYDMVGNVSQQLSTCYYDGYESYINKELDNKSCEYASLRGSSWHYPPQPHADRGRFKKEGWEPGPMLGFRLATDDVIAVVDESTIEFERKLKLAQNERLANRVKLPLAPQNLQIKKSDDQNYVLSWQANKEHGVIGYDIYRSIQSHAHLLGLSYKDNYEKVKSVSPNETIATVQLPQGIGSFRVVAIKENISSPPSQPVIVMPNKVISIPGKIEAQHATQLENLHLRYAPPTDEKPEMYFMYKRNDAIGIPLVTASFVINVESSGWYYLNYNGRSSKGKDMFKFWQDNRLLADVKYDKEVDDKVSERHKVYLEKGEQVLQLTNSYEGRNSWSLAWLSFSKAE